MKQPARYSIAGLVLAVLAAVFYPKADDTQSRGDAARGNWATPAVDGTTNRAATAPATPASTPKPAVEPASAAGGKPKTASPAAKKVGFTSQRAWQDHFTKHGAEFGDITADEYLARAQALRDAPLSADVLELVRDSDAVIARFDRLSGAFVAFHRDKSIRTYFRPNDGEAYFRRQADR